MTEINSWETTPKIRDYLKSEVAKLKSEGVKYATETIVNQWSDHIKNELKIKGKPLFMGMRGVLTGKDHGPDLKFLIPLPPIEVLSERI